MHLWWTNELIPLLAGLLWGRMSMIHCTVKCPAVYEKGNLMSQYNACNFVMRINTPNKTSRSAVAKRSRCRVVSYGQKWKTGTGRQYLRTLSVNQPLWRNWPAKQPKSVKKTQNKGYYAVQGHSMSSRLVSIESPYATSYYWLILTDILSGTVSELSQLIVPILDTWRFWATLRGLRDNVRCSSWSYWKARSGLLINVNWTFSLGVTAQALRAKIDRKSAISHQLGQFDPKFQVEGTSPTNRFYMDS